MERWVLDLLACPRDAAPLTREGDRLLCPHGHHYAIVDEVPILLVSDAVQTHWVATDALGVAARGHADPSVAVGEGEIDPWVQAAIGATNGNLYRGVIGRLPRYPIPRFPLRTADSDVLIDIGCNWGRWSLAASRAGFRVIGIDPAFDAVRAARRVATQLDVEAAFIVGDARFLPIASATVDVAFSFSVLQHLAESDVAQTASSIGRVLKPGGLCLVQMAARYGPRSIVQQARRGFRAPKAFEVRYWAPSVLLGCFASRIGPARLEPDAFFSLNARPEDLDLLTRGGRGVVRVSKVLTAVARRVPLLTSVADSVWVRARRI